jgi:hypothetical protein
MQKKYYSYLYLITMAAVFVAVFPVYASNSAFGRIRGYSSRQNDRLSNKIAIGLVNGKTSEVSIDNMAKLIKNYGLIQFGSGVNNHAREMITRETAYRMIKNSYLPRFQDKIHVQKQSSLFQSAIGINSLNNARNSKSLVLPAGQATIQHGIKVDTLRWTDISSQVSSAVEKLWIDRINEATGSTDYIANDNDILKALDLLNSIREDTDEDFFSISQVDMESNALGKEIISLFDRWLRGNLIDKSDIPVIAYLIRQYIIFASPEGSDRLALTFRSITDVKCLQYELIERINTITENIKKNNPSDYITMAMLNSILEDITAKFLVVCKDTESSRHSLKASF